MEDVSAVSAIYVPQFVKYVTTTVCFAIELFACKA